jgi:hypothetical protein
VQIVLEGQAMQLSKRPGRTRALVVALAAAAVLAAVGASSAAADWVVGGITLTTNAGLEPVPPMVGSTTFTTATSPAVKIECAQAGNLEIGESIISPLTEGRYGLFNFLSYGKCAVVSPANCTLTSGALKTTALKWSVTGTTTVVVTLSPLSGTTVYEAAVSGAGCSPLATVKATGQLVAELGAGTTPAVTHSLKFTGVSGSGTLSAASGAATLELRSHKEWNWH